MNNIANLIFLIYKITQKMFNINIFKSLSNSILRSIVFYVIKRIYTIHKSSKIKINEKPIETFIHNKNSQTLISIDTPKKRLDQIFGNYEYTTNVYKTNIDNIALTYCQNNNKKFVFYLGGSNDYFYNVELSKLFLDLGYDFYAFDIPNSGFAQNRKDTTYYNDYSNVNQLVQYMKSMLDTIDKKYNVVEERIILCHSRGVLLATKFMDSNKKYFNRMICNSPFLSIYEPNKVKRFLINPIFYLIGLLFPKIKIKSDEYKMNRTVYSTTKDLFPYGLSPNDVKEIAEQYRKDKNTKFNKKFNNHEVQHGRYILFEAVFLATIYMYVETQLLLKLKRYNLPTLVLCSDKSNLTDIDTYGDYVLNVQDIQKISKKIFTNLTLEVINDASTDVDAPKGSSYHDIYASPNPAKKNAFFVTRKFLSLS